ncbi:MAG: isochorismate synthase [Candidatus Lambdaproteobacteria bacterium]|nr:isochorismate synthase [Candidatus Lambdaproteobacteria bacterium]
MDHESPLPTAPPRGADPKLALAGGRMVELAGRAVRRAAEGGRPVLCSWHAEVEPVDALALFAALGSEGFRFYWERPKDGFALAAAGVALRCRAEGPARFEAVGAEVEAVFGSAAGAGDAPPHLAGPFAVGGFSFFDEVDEAQWPGFSPAQLVFPAWSLACRAGRCAVTVSALAAPRPDALDTAVAELAAELARGFGRVRQALPEALHAPPGGTAAPAAPVILHHADGVAGHRQWVAMVRAALGEIRGGQLSKIVLARVADLAAARGFSHQAVLARLRGAYPNCFTFLVDPGGGRAFLGATPERLARFEGRSVRLGALAGTAPRGERADADELLARGLMESGKERAEHAYVVDAIVRAVAPLADAIARPDAPQLVKLNNVQHLYTPITLRLRERQSPFEVLRRLHPTPAVGGHPSQAACARIRACEDFDRGWYAAPVGWLNGRGEGEFAVALRSGTLQANRARLFAGSGIVAGSDAEAEYFETQLKLQPMLTALAFA